jgi:hypothetical protein
VISLVVVLVLLVAILVGLGIGVESVGEDCVTGVEAPGDGLAAIVAEGEGLGDTAIEAVGDGVLFAAGSPVGERLELGGAEPQAVKPTRVDPIKRRCKDFFMICYGTKKTG